ncbi:MAG: TIGR03016 family PEP-CTERM system-associated outer membrane protein, partial [Rhodanobacteraceae bacterium]
MRVLSAPVVLSSLALTGWVAGAGAQDAGIGALPTQLLSPTLEQAACAQTGTAEQQPGVVPQPNPDCPGVVLGVTGGELYTDNLKLAAQGKPKETMWITTVEPFVKAAWSNPRFVGLVDYSLTGFLYAGQSSNNQIAQRLDALGTLTLVPQHFFLDGTARYSRAIINNQLPAGSGTFFLNGNLANVAVATLSPWWTQTFGLGTATLRYTEGRVMYNRNGISGDNPNSLSGISNVTSSAVQFSFVSPQYERWAWNYAYVQQRLDPDAGPSRQFATTRVGASFEVNAATNLLGDAGLENRFRPDGTISHLDAPFWDVGIDWANALNSFKVLVGHRFYGRSGELSWTHNAALLTTTLSYTEQPTDLNQQLLGQNPGEVVLPPVNPQRFPSLAERQIYLMKRAMATATYQMPRGNLTLALYDESRRFFVTGVGEERVANASLSWRYDIGPFTTLTPTLGWQRYRFEDNQINYSRFGELALVHQFSAADFATIRLRNDSRSAYAPIPG